MTAQQIDNRAILEREKAMRVRNAYLALLRAFEDMYDLPRSVPTKDSGARERSSTSVEESRRKL